MNIYMNYETNYTRKAHSIKVPKGMDRISPVKPRTDYYHYSRDDSQGALICQTKGFPNYFNGAIQDYCSAYSDRIMSWDYDRFEKACDIAGGGDSVWAYRLPSLSEGKLKEFAQVALNLSNLPTHVRVVHWFNVSSGYSCPTVEAIVDK
jgi:hypothetical protein